MLRSTLFNPSLLDRFRLWRFDRFMNKIRKQNRARANAFRFSDRLYLTKKFEEYCEYNNLLHHPQNVITWLETLGLYNYERLERLLKFWRHESGD